IMGFSDALFRRLKLLLSRFLKLTSGTCAPTRSGCTFTAESGTDWAQTSTAPAISSNPQQSDNMSFLNKLKRILFVPPQKPHPSWGEEKKTTIRPPISGLLL